MAARAQWGEVALQRLWSPLREAGEEARQRGQGCRCGRELQPPSQVQHAVDMDVDKDSNDHPVPYRDWGMVGLTPYVNI